MFSPICSRTRQRAGDRAISTRPADLIGRKIANPRPATEPLHSKLIRRHRWLTLASAREDGHKTAAQIWFRSSLPFADVFVRLCDVDERGHSFNICDGLVSISGADEISCVDVQMWPTAYRFKRGHRIRIQVSSGAFPRFARNPGTGEPLGTATTLKAADQSVYHDPGYQSAVILPVLEGWQYRHRRS
jgi:X-Pro dipeptidyl-peptidase C-terminal non-catalytic domain